MLAIIISVVTIGVVVGIIIAVLKPSKQEKQALAEQEERLKDERLYDSVTGRYLTLEEAENEAINADDYIGRIKSDEEIEKNYSEDEREVEYIIRDMLQFGIPEAEDERIFELISNSKIYETVESHSINNLWEIKQNHFLGIASVTSSFSHGRSDSRTYAYQIIGIVQGKLLNTQAEAYEGIEFIEISETQIFKVSKKITRGIFEKLRGVIQNN
jgi:hypothetical protein